MGRRISSGGGRYTGSRWANHQAANQVDLQNVVLDAGNLAVTATNIDLNGATYTTATSGNVTFTGAVDLALSGSAVAINTSTGNGSITFTSTIDDDSAGDTDLTLTAGTGAVDLQGAVGATNRLDDFTVASAATSDLMNVAADTIAVTSTNIDLKGTTYTSSVGGITLTGAVDLDLSAGTVAVDSSANNQNITFTSTIDDDSAGDTDLTLTAGNRSSGLTGSGWSD